jgi:MarR family transcriptional regulator, organic hydroperoxide resistance regulator
MLVEVVNYPWVRLSWVSSMGRDTDPAVEAWELLWRLMQANKPRFMALAQELGLAPMQLHALRLIEPGVEVPMSSLAGKLFCDASNVTGIVDRLEARGLIERRPAEHDRRVKLLVLTGEGDRVRSIAESQMTQPPPEIAALPLEHKRALRDALRAAMASREDGVAAPTNAPAV